MAAVWRDRRRFVAFLCVSAIALTLISPALRAVDRLTAVGAFASEGPIYLDVPGRILYHVGTQSTSTGGLGSSIQIFDLDTLTKTGTVDVDMGLAPFLALNLRGAGMHMQGGLAAVDQPGHRLFFPYRDATTNLPQIGIVDARSPGPIGTHSYPLVSPLQGGDLSFGVEAMDYRPEGDVLYLLLQYPAGIDGSNTGPIYVQAVRGATGEVLWNYQVSQCGSLFPNLKMMPPLGHTTAHIYLACDAGNNQAGTAVVLKMHVSDSTSQPDMVASFASPELARAGVFDTIHERLYVFDIAGLLAAFDAAHEVWVGLVLPGSRPQMGADPMSGRLYLCGQAGSGLFSTDAGLATPVPPGDEEPTVDCNASESWPIRVDGMTRRVFLEINTPEGLKWTASRDNLAPYEAPSAFDPDLGAEDVDEVSGRTDRAFSTQGAAYGTRLVMVGGPMGAIDNSTFLVGQGIRGNGGQTQIRFAEGSREVRLGRVSKAKLSDSGLEGRSIAMDRDNRVESDFSMLRQHPANPTGDGEDTNTKDPQWPYDGSTCFAFGGDSDEKTNPDPNGGSTATCDFKTLSFDASADSPTYGIPGLITIGESSAHVVARPDPVKGVITNSSAVSRNINIADQIFIAEVTATVSSWAKGRPGKADTLYERRFRGVKVLDPGGNVLYECRTVHDCLPQAVVDAINTALGPRVIAELPEPDQELVHGSPMGTTSIFKQDEWRQVEERVLYDKPVEDLTMPALSLRLNANFLGSSGLIVQLAGVTASSGYRVFKLPEPAPLESGPPLITIPSVISAPPPPPPPPPPSAPKTIVRELVEKIRVGTRLVFGLGHDFRSVLAGWLLLLTPFYIGMRRRALMKGISRVRGSSTP